MKITLRAARINKGFLIKEVALLIGISDEVLRNYERGRTAIPEAKMDSLLYLYGITKDDLKEENKNG